MGEQSGNRKDDVGHVLAAAVVAGEGPQVLQVGDAVFNADAPGGVRMALLGKKSLIPGRQVLFELSVRRCHDPSAGLGPEPLIPGVGEHGRLVLGGQQIGEIQLSGVGDVRATARYCRAAVQHAPIGVG
jgi:hypothetical protein